jgi:trehalose/maltose hydrolase-like predicted phosphorylase
MPEAMERYARATAFDNMHVVRWSNVFLAIVAISALTGCGSETAISPTPRSVAHKTAPADPWLLTCLDPNVKNPALLWNGQIGVRLGRGCRASGQMFFIDEYDTAGEEKIKPVECPVSVEFGQGSNDFDPATSTDYAQTLDMRTGILLTKWTQDISTATHPRTFAHVTCETAIHPAARMISQRWTCTADREMDISFSVAGAITDGPDTTTSSKELHGSPIEWSVRKRFLSPDPRHVAANARFAAEATWSFGHSKTWLAIELARGISVQPSFGWDPDAPKTFDEVAGASKETWRQRWKTDIRIEGPVEDQQAIRSFLFYLRSSIAANGSMSLSPFALSSDDYNGHIFWDADVWAFPVLALVDPEVAKAIPNYRLATRAGALMNELDPKPAAKPHLKEAVYNPNFPRWAWESSVSGKETAPAAMRKEIHISGDVPWMLSLAASLDLVPLGVAKSAIADAGRYFLARASGGPPAQLELRSVVSPDESHWGHNDLYTNLLAQWCVNGGTWQQPKNAPSFKLPRDGTSLLTYDDDPMVQYKQAAAVLSIYPLQFPEAEKEARTMMHRFAPKVAPTGLAMSDSLHALIWARLSEEEMAYDTWRRSWQRFVREPQLQFSEKQKFAKPYFTTGAAGCLQTVIYGFLGIRIDEHRVAGAAWTLPLENGKFLSISPHLPPAWKSVTFSNLALLGRRYTVVATHKKLTVTPEAPAGRSR